MDSVDKVIYYIETGQHHNQEFTPDEPTEIYDAVDKLKEGSDEKFLNFWVNIKEYQRAKLQRSNVLPVSSEQDDEKNINIKIVGNNRDTRISPDIAEE